jgi:hypothetical protein
MEIFKLEAISLTRLGEALLDAPHEVQDAARLALNKTMDWVYPRVVKGVAKVTGIQQKRVRMLIKKHPAKHGGELVASIRSRGQFTSLKDFMPRQTKKGVVAAPWGKRRVFAHTFIGPNGHVYKRLGKGRVPIEKLWGPAIPKEMIGETIVPIVNEATQRVFPKNYEFYYDRAMEHVKEKFGL